jgi:hypothetical protein
MHLMLLGNQEQAKLEIRRWKNIIKIREELMK